MKKTLVFGATIKLSLEQQNGIMKKVFAQTRVFESAFDVYTWGFGDNEILYIHSGEVTVVDHFQSKAERRIKYFNALTCFVLDKQADAFYFRYASCDFFLLNALRLFKKNDILSVIEIPTYPNKAEFQDSMKKRLIYLLDSMLRNRMKKYVSRIVLFVENPKELFGIPCINTRNGIDSSVLCAVHSTPTDTLNMIAVASMLPHHGLDRMIEGLNRYYSQNSDAQAIVFHVVGDGPKLKEYQDLVKLYGMDEHIKFYGQKTGNALDDLFENMDIAVGSLGFHRNGLTQASTLKNPEYAVRGLPIVYSTPEVFLKDAPYALELPADDSPVDMEEVLHFWSRMQTIDNIHEEIRKDAVTKCDMSITMAPVVKYMQDNVRKMD